MTLIKSNKLYDTVKHFALVTLPAIGTLYFALAQVWGLPYAEEVTGSIVALDTFLGVTVFVSNKQYQKSDDAYDGSIEVNPDKDAMNFKMDSSSIVDKDEVRLKVTKPTPTLEKVKRARRGQKEVAKDPNGA